MAERVILSQRGRPKCPRRGWAQRGETPLFLRHTKQSTSHNATSCSRRVDAQGVNAPTKFRAGVPPRNTHSLARLWGRLLEDAPDEPGCVSIWTDLHPVSREMLQFVVTVR